MADDPVGLSASARPRNGLADADVRAQLDAILVHRDFEATERTREFLRFVVEETLANRAHRLKGYTIAVEVFGRSTDFDANLDPIVRIQAGRLRRALEHYYLVAGRDDPIRIDMPKGGYVPTFTSQPQPTAPSPGSAPGAAGTRHTTSTRPTIAVLPFRDDSEDPDQTLFANGLVDELLGELDRYEDVVCVSCGDEPGAGTATARFQLGGSVRRDASHAKVFVHCTDTADGQRIWSDSYRVEHDRAALIESQEDIARRVVAAVADTYGAVARRLTDESKHTPVAALSPYEAMLRYHHYMLVMTPDAALSAFAALQAITARAPDYGPAWAGLANLHCHALVFDLPGFDAPLETAYAYARQAAALSPDSQLARIILAYVHLLRNDLDAFRREAESALERNPHSPNSAGTIGYLHTTAGDTEPGCRLLAYAMDLSPHHPQWFHHGMYCCRFAQGDYAQAYQEVLKIGHPPGFWDPALRAATLAKLGRTEEARAAGRELLEMKPDVGSRIRGILRHTVKLPAVVEDFLDGLRQAGVPVTG